MLLRFSKANVKKIAVVFVVVVVLRGIKQIRHPALTQNSTRKDKRISGGRKRFKENYLAFGADKREKKEALCAEEAQGLNAGLADLYL